MHESLIAPCGMNCAVCRGYLALKHEVRSKGLNMSYCTGCRPRDKQCAFLKKRCKRLLNGKVRYCYECPGFPCKNLLKLDKRYRADYRLSFVENLEFIRDNGIEAFLQRETEKWKCPGCGGVVCCHNGICFNCGLDKLAGKTDKYHWD